MASRLLLANTATRPKMHARCMLSGPPGAGKTDTALTIARELAKGDLSKVLVIDTEKDSALTYADRFPGFRHLPWDPPYAPSELGTTVIEASKQPETEVIIVDSLTHFWRKRGGTMDIAGGKFGGWKAARPIQEEMVDALLGAQSHVIVCVRSKVEYAQMEDEQRRGRQKVVKMGMEPQQDGDLEYEMNIAIELDMEHAMYVGKSRTTDIPVGRVYAPGQAAEFGAHYTDWLAGGTEISALSLEALQTTLGQLHPEVTQRMRVLWTERGLPNINQLNPAQINRVVGLIEQAQADFAGQQPQSPMQAPQAAAPAQQPTPQAYAPQNGAQPPQEPQQAQAQQPQQGGWPEQPQGGYAQDAGAAALQQQRAHYQQ
ncbi:AAA-ATPase [Arthrobacter phage Ottawa]|nr:AAA-ATPase [Arthrobacter phage Kharcho]WIC89286.1 AAA-ATPase [Arthrobacter phage Ottawa]